MLGLLDRFLDRVTMYRLLVYYLIALLAVAVGLSFFHYLQYNPFAIAFSAGYITLICWMSNLVFANAFEAPVNTESFLITALILALIVTPMHSAHDILFLTAVSGLAIASKFIIAINKKHIFNPAAVAVILTAFGPQQSASWWVGSLALMPFVVVGGLLIVRKIRRERMVGEFLVAALGSTVVANVVTHHNVLINLRATLLHSSLFFLALVMLTEPLTSPPTDRKRTWYAAIAGILFPPQIHILSVYSTPELALVMANIYSYVVSPKVKLLPKLVEKQRLGPSVVDFTFVTQRPLKYLPGQYMEWTLPHEHPDNRGNRRYLTLASSPTEKNLRLGVKFYQNGSTYKQAMLKMDTETPIAAGQLGGDFTLPKDITEKLVFIAGGIGITPFRSMLKYLVDTGEQRTVTLMYSEVSPKDFAYTDVFTAAHRALGTNVIYTVTGTPSPDWAGQTGYITEDTIKQHVPDYAERTFYISGPHSMVTSMQHILVGLGLPRQQIKTDFFPGYA